MATTAHIITSDVDAESGGGLGGPGGAENDSELEQAGENSESTFGERQDPPCFKCESSSGCPLS